MPFTRRLIRTTSAVACATSSLTKSSSTPSAMLSSDSRNAVRGVRSWCEASATKMRCAAIRVSRRSPAWLSVRARVCVSFGPVTGERAVRSPSLNRLAVSLSWRSGRVSRRATPAPTTAATTRTATARPARKPQIVHSRSVRELVSYTMRTAPTTGPLLRPSRSVLLARAATVIFSSGPQMKDEPQSVVDLPVSRALVRAASCFGRGRSVAQRSVTSTSPGVWPA